MKKVGLICALPLTRATLSFADQITGYISSFTFREPTKSGHLSFADQITGYISEAHCGAKHHAVSEANTKCINGCLKGGSDPVLVKGDTVLTFDADSKEKAKAFAGQQVTIDGTVDGNVVKINSVQKAAD